MSKPGRYSRWDTREQYLYFVFLRLKEDEFKSYASRKSSKVFDYFAHLVGSRDRLQVKSHHQKLMAKHHSVREFLEYYQTQNDNHLPHYQSVYITPKIRTIINLHLQRLQPHHTHLQIDSILGPLPHAISSAQNYILSSNPKSGESTSESGNKEDEKEYSPQIYWNDEQDMSLQSFPIPPL